MPANSTGGESRKPPRRANTDEVGLSKPVIRIDGSDGSELFFCSRSNTLFFSVLSAYTEMKNLSQTDFAIATNKVGLTKCTFG